MNESKKKSLRFWDLWRKSGAVVDPFKERDENIAKAKDWLEYARNRLSDNTSRIGYIREYLTKAKATLEDIGTNEKELVSLA